MSGSKVRISTALFERRPYFGAQKRCHILYFVFINPENFMCLACLVQKFEVWWPHLGGPPFWYPQILSNFLFFIFT